MSANRHDRRAGNMEESLDPWQIKRMRRIEFIKSELQARNEVDERHFLGEFCSRYGIRRLTLIEYLRDLEDFGVIEIAEGRIRIVNPEAEGAEEE